MVNFDVEIFGGLVKGGMGRNWNNPAKQHQLQRLEKRIGEI
jgi:hypothetical protein